MWSAEFIRAPCFFAARVENRRPALRTRVSVVVERWDGLVVRGEVGCAYSFYNRKLGLVPGYFSSAGVPGGRLEVFDGRGGVSGALVLFLVVVWFLVLETKAQGALLHISLVRFFVWRCVIFLVMLFFFLLLGVSIFFLSGRK